MKVLTLFFLLVFSQQILAQQALEISSTGSDKVKIFKENKRVKVKTLQGEKFIGRFQIMDGKNIEIEGNIISLNDIENIKSRSIAAGIAATGLIVYGAVVVVVGIVVGLNFANTPDIFIVGGIGAIIMGSGIFFNEFAKNHRTTKWSYKIINQ
ncbi:MAG: hypothetical protein ABJ092_08580 [Gillisia sp.]